MTSFYMTIDRADWHHENAHPTTLATCHGATHIGLYLAWIIENRLEGSMHHHMPASSRALARVRSREITGREFLLEICDGKFWQTDLSPEGLAFTRYYYAAGPSGHSPYLQDYDQLLGEGLPSLYHVADTWANYDRLRPLLNERYQAWRQANGKTG